MITVHHGNTNKNLNDIYLYIHEIGKIIRNYHIFTKIYTHTHPKIYTKIYLQGWVLTLSSFFLEDFLLSDERIY